MENLGSKLTNNAVLQYAADLTEQINPDKCVVILVKDDQLHVFNNVDTVGDMLNIVSGVAAGLMAEEKEESSEGQVLQ